MHIRDVGKPPGKKLMIDLPDKLIRADADESSSNKIRLAITGDRLNRQGHQVGDGRTNRIDKTPGNLVFRKWLAAVLGRRVGRRARDKRGKRVENAHTRCGKIS